MALDWQNDPTTGADYLDLWFRPGDPGRTVTQWSGGGQNRVSNEVSVSGVPEDVSLSPLNSVTVNYPGGGVWSDTGDGNGFWTNVSPETRTFDPKQLRLYAPPKGLDFLLPRGSDFDINSSYAQNLLQPTSTPGSQFSGYIDIFAFPDEIRSKLGGDTSRGFVSNVDPSKPDWNISNWGRYIPKKGGFFNEVKDMAMDILSSPQFQLFSALYGGASSGLFGAEAAGTAGASSGGSALTGKAAEEAANESFLQALATSEGDDVAFETIMQGLDKGLTQGQLDAFLNRVLPGSVLPGVAVLGQNLGTTGNASLDRVASGTLKNLGKQALTGDVNLGSAVAGPLSGEVVPGITSEIPSTGAQGLDDIIQALGRGGLSGAINSILQGGDIGRGIQAGLINSGIGQGANFTAKKLNDLFAYVTDAGDKKDKSMINSFAAGPGQAPDTQPFDFGRTLLTGLGGLYQLNQMNKGLGNLGQSSGALRSASQQAGNDWSFYEGKLRQLYNDPNAFLRGSPQYKVAEEAARRQLARRGLNASGNAAAEIADLSGKFIGDEASRLGGFANQAAGNMAQLSQMDQAAQKQLEEMKAQRNAMIFGAAPSLVNLFKQGAGMFMNSPFMTQSPAPVEDRSLGMNDYSGWI